MHLLLFATHLDNSQYLLVVTTAVEIVVLAVQFSDDDVARGRMILHPTQFTVSSDNVNMIKVVGTPNGRIFMAGADGCVYELHYSLDASYLEFVGLGSKCRKVNLSGSSLRYVHSMLNTQHSPVFTTGVGTKAL